MVTPKDDILVISECGHPGTAVHHTVPLFQALLPPQQTPLMCLLGEEGLLLLKGSAYPRISQSELHCTLEQRGTPCTFLPVIIK